MSEPRQIPNSVTRFEEWDVADRMRRTLRVTGITVAEIAEDLGVSREAVGTWINGRVKPRKTVLMAWALRTGAPYEWLTSGESGNDKGPDPEGPGPDEVHPLGLEPRTH